MKKSRLYLVFALVFSFFLAPFAAQAQDAKLTPSPTIKVLLAHEQPGVIIEVKGQYQLFDPRNGEHISSRYKGKRRMMQTTAEGLKWGEEFPGLHQIAIVPDLADTATIVDGIEYFGAIYVYDIGGSISVVNQLPIEEYLNALITDMTKKDLTKSDMPQELWNAIAITARTNAYFQAQNSKTPYWDVDALVVGYKGALSSSDLAKKALFDTRLMVLSRIGVNNWVVTPFAVQWSAYNISKTPNESPEYSKISILEAVAMAKKGQNAAEILTKAFPGTKIELYHYSGNAS